jgi:hypothetical protein
MSYVLDTYEDEATGCRVEITIDEMAESPREWSNVFSLCLKSRDYTLVEEDIDPIIQAVESGITDRIWELEELLDDADTISDDPISQWQDELDSLTVMGKDGIRGERQPTLAEIEEEFGGRIFPVYAYIHSGIALSTSRVGYLFNDVWDSGQLGFALVSNAKIQEEFLNYYPDGRWIYAEHPSTEKIDHGDVNDWLYYVLKGELSALEDYWMGNVYCIDAHLPDDEDCWDLGGDCGMCGIYDDDAHKEDGYLRTEARNLLANIVNNYQDSEADGMLAMDIFAATELVLS